MQALFEAAYFARFQVRLPEIKAVVVNLNTSVVGKRRPFSVASLIDIGKRAARLEDAAIGRRALYGDGGWLDATIYDRERLPADVVIEGPAVIQQVDATTVIEADSVARVDAVGNLRIAVNAEAARAFPPPEGRATRAKRERGGGRRRRAQRRPRTRRIGTYPRRPHMPARPHAPHPARPPAESAFPAGGEKALDPLTLAVIQAGLQQVCNEMDVAFSRSAFSPVIAEADDRSDGIYAAEDGALIAQGEHGLPVFVGTMQYSAGELIRLIGEGAVAAPQEGDIYIVNDPYLGGTHLMDVRFAMPFFHDGALFCWLSNTGHWPDTGGMVPGGFSAHATEVEQEGLRLPPVKLFKRGVMDREILSIILSNIRVADQRIGDIKAQEAALKVGERRLSELLARYGRRDDRSRDRRDQGARRAAHAGRDRGDPRRDLSHRELRRFGRDRERAAAHRADADEARRQHGFRLFGFLAALPRPDELGRGDDLFGRLSGGAPRLSRRCRSTPAASIRSSSRGRRGPFSTPATRARSRAAPPRCRSGSPRRCSWRWRRRSPRSSGRRRPAPRAISPSAASTLERAPAM